MMCAHARGLEAEEYILEGWLFLEDHSVHIALCVVGGASPPLFNVDDAGRATVSISMSHDHNYQMHSLLI